MRLPYLLLPMFALVAACSQKSPAPENSVADNVATAPGEAPTAAAQGNDEVAQLQAEGDRLYALAISGKYMTAERKPELLSSQAGWDQRIAACGSDSACLLDAHAARIAGLRVGYADARTPDEKGISKGPSALLCDGLDAGISIVAINSNPGAVHMVWLDKAVTLLRSSGEAGEQYDGKTKDGDYGLKVSGDGATFTVPGKPAMRCRYDDIG